MNEKRTWFRQAFVYTFGLFFLGIGVTFSILSDTGVPPIASFPYAITLITNISIGVTVIFAHFIFILLQIIILRAFSLISFLVQMTIAILLGFFFDLAAWILRFLPEASTYFLQGLYLFIGVLITGLAIFLYFSSNLTMNPYDTLTRIITEKAKRPFGVVRVYCDVSVVGIALAISLIGLQSFGSVGIGTVIGSYTIGKVTGFLLTYLQPNLQRWMYKYDDKRRAM